MLKIKEAIVVEGRYDKNTLSQLVDTLILTTEGFQVFKRKDRVELLRRVAEKRGLIVLTDSDGAGFLIRNHLKGVLPPGQVKHCYIPDVYGKERRKRTPGKEGKLGVEGMRPEVLEAALRRCGATILGESAPAAGAGEAITALDLYETGLSGRDNSARLRQSFLREHKLPEHLSSKALVQVLNTLMTREEFYCAAEALSPSEEGEEKP
jgi:ribonuclease M5